jgi:hypothetical protein
MEIFEDLNIFPNRIYFLEELSHFLLQLNDEERNQFLNEEKDLEKILNNREINDITKSIKKGKDILLKILKNHESQPSN